ncbi:MAG: tRNA (adenosine(37)-N6)-threonylcarbamoyltransferase complex ATPase subunit type 1 TsaE [Clostridia bacterium]|nr:tRNA (adenosine(37)-N6)-threonylcarbamoyltransferase complex ATPase subunit type 1 TsaE [Clostridia bacterium]
MVRKGRIVTEQVILEKESGSEQETEQIGADFAAKLEPDAFVALSADLGSGKTAFARGMAQVLCPGARVCSPTYTVMRCYEGEKGTFYHFDMYRITSPEDLESVGFYDCEGIIAAEWCENTPYALPDRYYQVTIEKTGEQRRLIRITREKQE